MPVNRDYVGREYPADESYEVSREKIRDFALAIGDHDPCYLDTEAARAAGHPDVVAPPTFLVVLGTRFEHCGPLADSGFGVDFSMIVHGEQRFVAHRPVYAGDRLVSKQVVTAVRSAAGNEIVTTATFVHLESGVPVADVISTLVVRGAAGEGAR